MSFGRLVALAVLLMLWTSASASAKHLPKTLTNSVGIEFVLVPAGSFQMGTATPSCPKDDPSTEKNERQACMSNVFPNEQPQHKATISRAFYLGKTEVTQQQWVAVMGTNPSGFNSKKVGGDSRNHPVENVSWGDVQAFIQKLNKKEGKAVYRLPTEAEWEYACRAGSRGKYSFGDDDSELGRYAWIEGNSGEKTHPVGQLRPNAWGLYDMHGNVWEWVQDWYGEEYYGSSPSTDPSGPSEGSGRVYRGGSWFFGAVLARAAFRSPALPVQHYDSLGFRLARTAP